MSFNNYVDAEAAWQLVCDFEQTACAIIKHTNPAGVGLGETPRRPIEEHSRPIQFRLLAVSSLSIAQVDAAAAQEVTEIFTEVVIAPDYEPEALELLRRKEESAGHSHECSRNDRKDLSIKQIGGGMLVQTRTPSSSNREDLKVVTESATDRRRDSRACSSRGLFASTRSQTPLFMRATSQTVGVGAGQMSRVDSVKIGAMRAQLPVEGSVLASDAFFPFRDGLDEAASHGITAVIQPGGSVRDDEVIAAANEHGLAMVFTGVRHFKH